MSRRVYFAFHYQADISRVNVIRNSWVTKEDREAAGFFDASLWEKTKKDGDLAIKRMINKGLENTSVTAFLLGTQTADRLWVKYELEKSFERGNGLLAIHIHKIKDLNQKISSKGRNILSDYYMTVNGEKKFLSEVYDCYDWVDDDGYNSFADWVEAAASIAGK